MTRAVRLNTIMCRNGNIENLLPNLYKMRAKYIKYIYYIVARIGRLLILKIIFICF